ncbi:CDF family Co(II)/Ni(II) efflux transporter DmeF [Microvirga sp. Mcv34]|uniref:CDF family Co(II)/Ni(II) efflux transporter DmeF n=1 Tax=Microvirga sp. Mcv34 TaxID=2926016 RepID=UPI0021CA0441|nr:CDF family Co(II)/Ni(II) efflux transporter DmeF [Microvirga sp. Mcv34]
MHGPSSQSLQHEHVFLGDNHERNERRTWFVIALTATMMVVEIVAGTIYGSMALVADGWHMSTHAAAMLISALAYFYARRHAHNPRFTFGTGKLGDLAGFASAIILALIALLIGWESVLRLANPIPIDFGQAIAVAAIGLVVNLASAWLLKDDHHHGGHHHHHGHGYDHGHHHGHHHGHGSHHEHDHHDHSHAGGRDNNLRAAYLHVLADALTSVLAIVALLAGSVYGWLWLDPLMGIVGALVIARWSWGLIRDAGAVLLDVIPEGEELPDEIREALEGEGDKITDLHVWQVGPGHHAAIISLASPTPKAPSTYKDRLSHLHELSHVTVEVQALPA